MKTNPTVVHVLHTESVLSRGGEKYLYELVCRVKKTYQVRLYLFNISLYWEDKYTSIGVPINVMWKPRFMFWLLLPLTIIVNFIQLKKQISKNQIVFATNFPTNLLAVLVSKNTICHCFEPLAIFYDPFRVASLSLFSRTCVRAAKLFYSGLDKWAYRNSRVFTALNRAVTPYITDTYKRLPDIYLPNGVDINTFYPASSARKNTGPLLVGHSTDFTIFKGTYDFLHIAKELSDMGVDFVAHISESIYDPAVKLQYSDFIQNNNLSKKILFIGNVLESKLASFYRSLDVFVYTGSPESAGGSTASLSVLEAQACGIPVFRSRGDDHEIQNGKTGAYINPHHHKEAAQIIVSFIKKSTKQKLRMKHQAVHYIKNNYAWDKAGNIFVQTVKNIL